MKIKELKPAPSHKIGKVNKNGVITEPHEDSTILYLTQFGFNIDLIKPTNAHKTKSADIFMSNSIWEIKSPTTNKESTIKEDFRKAKSQSDRIIFDLRRIKKYDEDVEKQLVKLFSNRGRVRIMIIIRKNGKVVDFSK